jgi:uncharacterized protein (TIGR04141 family)
LFQVHLYDLADNFDISGLAWDYQPISQRLFADRTISTYRTMPPKTNKLIVYLVKPQYDNPATIIESTQDGIDIGDVGTFYFEDSGVSTPSWVKDFFGASLKKDIKLLAASSRGVLLVPIEHDGQKLHFVVSFGLGRHLMYPGVIEDRFGLKVVLNSVDPNSLRSIDKTTLGSVPKHTREQIGKDSIAGDFGIDIEQDLISSVTGKSRYERLGKTISGKDALSVSSKVDIGNIKDFLVECYQQYLSKEYQKDFGWIDQIADVRDPKKIDELNDLLMAKLNKKEFDKIWMAVPEVVDWVDIKGFRYLRRKEADLVDDLDIKDFLEALKDKTLDIEVLKRSRVYVVSSKTDQVMDTAWSSYQCIYAEMAYRDLICILNNGKWYEIVKDFAEQIKKGFSQMEQSAVGLVDYAHTDENAYNNAAASTLPDSCCMDRELIYHGGGHSSIEFCDIYERVAKRMIHVKQYGGSSHLSHLFSQGAVAGELFVADQTFRQKLNEKLPAGYKLPDPKERPNATEYEIVFGIISNSLKPLDIPFFSKVSLKNAKRRLEGYGYKKVTLKKIQNTETQSSGSTGILE